MLSKRTISSVVQNRWFRTIVLLLATGFCATSLFLAGVFLYLNPQIPAAETYRHVQLETPMRVLSSEGALIAEFGERRRIPITLDQAPEQFINALLDTEDKRFYEHRGIDFVSLSRATAQLAGNQLLGRGIGPGASTITMQLARNISFTLERRFLRKFKEMLLSLKIEQELTKDQILALYINEMPFGKRAYGAEAAARTYYGKPLLELNLAQLAMLAGVLQAPTAGNPINGPERALKRRNLVLDRMRAEGSITELEHANARSAPITAAVHARPLDLAAPFPAEWVRRQLARQLPDIYTGGYTAYTTLKTDLQAAATRALRAGLIAYDRRHGYRGPEARFEQVAEALTGLAKAPVRGGLTPAVITQVTDTEATAQLADGSQAQLSMSALRWSPYLSVDSRGAAPRRPADIVQPADLVRLQPDEDGWKLAQLPDIQGALISLEPETGAVVAIEGGFDFGLNQFNHALQAERQPGSGFKPMVYAAALHHGVTPASIFMDAPLVFDDANLEGQYRPSNDNNRYNGPTRLREALYRSINLASMRVFLSVGGNQVHDYAGRFGFDTGEFPRNTQLAIGGGAMAVTPLEMARAYAVLANGGHLIEPHIIKRVENLEGEVILEPKHPVACAWCSDDEADMAETLPETEPDSLSDLLAEAPLEAPRVIDERVAFLMTDMMRDVIKRGTGRRARVLERKDLAGKTGTTNEAADTWFNGFNSALCTSVWVGFPSYGALGAREFGSTTPLPIWIDYMGTALDGVPESLPTQPPGIVTMRIDPETGAPAAANQENAIFEFFLAEHAPDPDEAAGLASGNDGAADLTPEDLF